MSERPLRIQRKRTKGWRMPPNTVSVTRRGPWGNPFRACLPIDAVRSYRRWLRGDGDLRSFGYPPVSEEIRTLRGKNLACWCGLCAKHDAAGGKPLDEDCPDCAPCHVDPLGRIANV